MNKISREEISHGIVPNHIAIIMDGNGRWAKDRRLPRFAGHNEGINSVREIVRICGEIGVEYLTLYTFSNENWSRPNKEVSAIMNLLMKTISKEISNLHRNNVRFNAIGSLDALPKNSLQGIKSGIEKTKENTGLNLTLALSYGGRQELLRAIKSIIQKVTSELIKLDDINEDEIMNELYTKNMPDPDLLIRTGGEKRISNFLLWQIAYTELYMTDTFWPDFREDSLLKSILDFQNRQRRFGKTGDQVQ
tara:strand:+ start:183 stop:929 length:747 start_codon:yes stop_codon:yes gene_type:complete